MTSEEAIIHSVLKGGIMAVTQYSFYLSKMVQYMLIAKRVGFQQTF